MLKKYKEWLSINEEKSKATIANYMARIQILLSELTIEDITEESIIKFLAKLKEENKSTSTINGYKNAIRSFLKFLGKDIPVPKDKIPDRKLPEYIDEKYFLDEIITTIEAVSSRALKHKAILYFMFYTGVRGGEIEHIKRENFDFQNNIVKIYIPKTREERLVLFSEKVKAMIQTYFNSEPENINAFNINCRGVKSLFERYSPYFKDINFHPHLFRHSFSAMFLKNGGDISDLKDLLGHKSLNSTARYSRLKIDDLKKKYDRFIK